MGIGWAAVGILTGFLPQSDASLDAYMRQLAIAGKVQVQNGLSVGPKLDANVQFDLSVQTRWDYTVSVIRRKGVLELVVDPKFSAVDVRVKHLLRLPNEDPASARFRTLLLHEYDHIAISTDERASLLLTRLVQTTGSIARPWGQGAIPPPDSQVNELIGAQVEARKAAVVKLIDTAYQKLDKLSDHGRQPLERANFARWLFSPDHFKESDFPFSKEAQAILSSPEAGQARRWFRS